MKIGKRENEDCTHHYWQYWDNTKVEIKTSEEELKQINKNQREW